MAEVMRDLRPRVQTFDGPGWRLSIVDPELIAATAVDRPVEVLHGTPFPPPVRRVRMTVATGTDGDRRVHVLTAAVQYGGPPAVRRSFALGNDPLGYLLSRGVEAGDRNAVRLARGLEAAVTQVSRRLSLPAPVTTDPPWPYGRELHHRDDVDAATGLRTTVTYHALPGAAGAPATGRDIADAGIVALRATVGPEPVTAAHLAAFFGVIVRVVAQVREAAGPDDRGGVAEFVLSADPAGRPGGPGPRPVTLDQVGGLDEVVAQFREIAVSFRNPGVMARWGARRPQGVLLYGPPGTGKTMLARALATEIEGTLREIRTPEILDKWLGASERNIQRIFREARRVSVPTVMLFDEFDSIIGYAGAGDDSGSHAINAIAGIFKQEMNNLIDDNPNVIVVATTNFPDLIDASLIRSGRFDVRIEIPLPDAAGRAAILTRMIRTLMGEYEVRGFRMFADDIDVAELAARTGGMTGADLRELLRRAQMTKAMQEARTGVRAEPIGRRDLLEAAARLR